MILDYVILYFIIGIIFAIVSDICIREMKSSEPFTFLEILGYILIWPIIVLIAINGFFNDNY
jgi:hypothetical protein